MKDKFRLLDGGVVTHPGKSISHQQTIQSFASTVRASNSDTITNQGRFIDSIENGIGTRRLIGRVVARHQKYVPTVQSVEELVTEQNQHRMGSAFEEHQNLEVSMQGGDGTGEEYLINSFEDCALTEEVKRNLHGIRYNKPTPLQCCVIPVIQKSTKDVLCLASTGTGKTGAFLIPIISRLQSLQCGPSGEKLLCSKRKRSPKAIVIAHTKELVQQIAKQARIIANDTGIGIVMAIGAVPNKIIETQLSLMQCGIVIATPGKLGECMDKGWMELDELQFVVVDEMDKYFSELEFIDIFRELKRKREGCKNSFWSCRTLFFSATMDSVLIHTVEQFLGQNFYHVQAGEANQSVAHVQQRIVLSDERHKKYELLRVLLQSAKEEQISPDGEKVFKCEKTAIFVNECRNCDRLAILLSYHGFSAISINGQRTLAQRTAALERFNTGEFDILVGTDVIGRGINLRNLERVILYNLPPTHRYEQYIHRVGRVGRLGNEGQAVIFFNSGDINDCRLAEFLMDQLKKAKQPVPEWLAQLVGDQTYWQDKAQEIAERVKASRSVQEQRQNAEMMTRMIEQGQELQKQGHEEPVIENEADNCEEEDDDEEEDFDQLGFANNNGWI